MAESEQAATADTGKPSYPSPVYSWYVVVVLTVAYMFSFLDRQILALLIEPIRQDLEITDFQISLLLGLAFGIFYTALGIPIGRLADRRSRRGIIAAGVTIWCLMTAACGLARNFPQLFLARIGVGVGEATLNPSAYSLISDYFPRKRRGRAISFYNMGVSLGAGVAMVVGGQIIAFAFDTPRVTLPIVGELFAWQLVFMLIGLPGLLVAALMITVREPERRDKLQVTTDRGETREEVSISETVRFLTQRWRTYGTHFLGMSVVTILGYGFLFWIPTMFLRTWQWSIPDISLAYGIIALTAGPIGVNAGGWLSDWLYSRGYRDAHMRMTLIGAIILVIASALVPLMPTPELAVAMLVPATIGAAIPTATAGAALMMIVPNQLRGQTTAIYYFVINVLGLSLGASAVAAVTDFVFGDDAALRYSVSIVAVVAGSFALLFLFANLKHYRASVIEADQWSETEGAG